MRISDWSSDVCSSDLKSNVPSRFTKASVSSQAAPIESLFIRFPVVVPVGQNAMDLDLSPCPSQGRRMTTNDNIAWRISDGLVLYPEALADMDERAAAIRNENASERIWLLRSEERRVGKK